MQPHLRLAGGSFATVHALLLIAATAAVVILPGCRTGSPGRTLAGGADSNGARKAPATVPLPDDEVAALAASALTDKYHDILDTGPKPHDQPGEAHEFFLAQRLAESMDGYPIEHVQKLQRELLERQAVQDGAGSGPGPGGVLGWNDIGPGNIGGRTRALVIDPTAPTTMITAGVTGGIWKTIDDGETWYATDDRMDNLAVSCLEMNPIDPSVVYAGTGEGFFGSSTQHRGLGIFKSIDGGESWTQLPGTVNGVPAGAFSYVSKIRISPNDPDRLYAATRTGVWTSGNAGATWTVALRNPRYLAGSPATSGSTVGCTDLAVRPDVNPDQLWAAFGSFESDGLYRSNDGGASWIPYTTSPAQGRMTIAIAPSDPDTLYLLMADNGTTGNQLGRVLSVFRSLNGGDTWESRPNFDHKFSPWLLSYAAIALGCVESPVIYSQGWYDNIIAVDPTDPSVVWVGGIDLYRSDDGGRTFGLANYWFYGRLDNPPPSYVHADQHLIVFHPGYNGSANQTMFVTNDGGLWRTDNALAATTQEECPIYAPRVLNDPGIGPPPQLRWRNLNNGYRVTQFYHGDVARDGADVFAGGAQDNGTSKVDAVDTPDDWDGIFGGDGGYVAIDPTDSDTMYVETQFFPRIYKTTDGGATFAAAVDGITDEDGLFITPFAMDPSAPETLWTGGSRPWRTANGAQSWELVGPDFSGPGKISAIAVAPSNSDVVYLGFDNGYVVRTTNGTDASPSWQTFVNGLYGGWVSSIAVDPADPDLAYITYSTFGIPHVLRTTNGGSTWTAVDSGIPDLPAHWIAIRPCDTSQLYVATELGVFASDDAAVTWQLSSLGLPNTIVETLAFPDDDSLVAFTYGRSAHRTELAPCGSAVGGAPSGPSPR